MSFESSPLFLMPDAALQISEGGNTSPHRHTVAQIIVSLDGELRVRHHEREPFIGCAAMLIPPNAPHHFADAGPTALMVWFDPATAVARAIRAWSPERMILLTSDEALQKLPPLPTNIQHCGKATALLETVSRALLPNLDTLPPLDKRVAATIDAMRQLPSIGEARPLDTLAGNVHLSPSRLRHLFRSEIGVSIQQYWIGQRLLRSIQRWNQTISLTHIAHDAGFADLAHFSRAFRSSFGLTPAVTRKDSRSIQVIVCSA